MNEIPTSENEIGFSAEEIEALSVTWFSFPTLSEVCPESFQISRDSQGIFSLTFVVLWPLKKKKDFYPKKRRVFSILIIDFSKIPISFHRPR